MMRFVGVLALVFALAVAGAGCLPAPREGDGRVEMRVAWTAAREAWRSLDEIAAVTAVLTRQKLTVTVAMTMGAGEATGTAEGLYAGEWGVRVDAATIDGTVIYTGETTVMVFSGQTSSVEMTLAPAPGKLDITMDVQFLLDQGHAVTGGKVGIYKDPDSGSADYEDMALAGAALHALVEDLAPQTYDARVVIPQATDAIFTSEYFQFDILPGRTTVVHITNDGQVQVEIDIIAEPGQVTGLAAIKDGTNVNLSWLAVSGATGYRVYRTDGEGRFRQCPGGLLDGGGVTTFTDSTFADADPYAGVVRYAVAALIGELEGLRSEPVAVVP